MNTQNPDSEVQLPLYELLPIRSLVVVLQATENARLDFFHQAALTAFLRFLLGSPARYERYIRLDAPSTTPPANSTVFNCCFSAIVPTCSTPCSRD